MTSARTTSNYSLTETKLVKIDIPGKEAKVQEKEDKGIENILIVPKEDT